jgi:hypothetical protein
VYCDLSDSPPVAWRAAFEQEWKRLTVGLPLSLLETSIDRAFLTMHCSLEEISRHVAVLKQAVAATNISYKKYVVQQATEQQTREDLWKDERTIVEDAAKSLHFD